MTITNRNYAKDYNFKAILRVDSVLYTGKYHSVVKKQVYEQLLRAGSMQKIIMPVSYDDYAPELTDQGAFNIACLANVKDTDFEFFSQDDFRVRKPDISIKVDL